MAATIPSRTLRMKDTLYAKLRYIAASDERSYNQQAIRILEQYVVQYEKEHGEIPVNDL